MTCKVSVLNEIVKQYPKLTIVQFMELLFESKGKRSVNDVKDKNYI